MYLLSKCQVEGHSRSLRWVREVLAQLPPRLPPLVRSRSLDLVLDRVKHQGGAFGGNLQDALRDYAARDTMQKVHPRNYGVRLITDIVSTLTPGGRRQPRQQYTINRFGTCCHSPFPPPSSPRPPNKWCGRFPVLLPTPFLGTAGPLPLEEFRDLVLDMGPPGTARQPFPLLGSSLIDIHPKNVTGTFTPHLKSRYPELDVGVVEGRW
jgi:hypothetical protein